jgi:hypothetical protein
MSIQWLKAMAKRKCSEEYMKSKNLIEKQSRSTEHAGIFCLKISIGHHLNAGSVKKHRYR